MILYDILLHFSCRDSYMQSAKKKKSEIKNETNEIKSTEKSMSRDLS